MIVRTQKSILLNNENLTFIFSIDLKLFDFLKKESCHFRKSNLRLIGFLYSSRRFRVEKESSMTHLYLGKKYVYRKRIVKHVANIHFSETKNANVFGIQKCQLAQTAPGAYAVEALRVTFQDT